MTTKADNIFTALARAQAKFTKLVKDDDNPHFRSKYAGLASVVSAVGPALNEEGIAFYHVPVSDDFGHRMITVLHHGASDTKIEAPVPLIISKQDMQGYKSATTYAKRIGLESAAGIAPDDDDDGNAAAQSASQSGGDVRTGGKPPNVSDWTWEVIKDLPPTATVPEKGQAIADALMAQFKRKKSATQLDNEWDRRQREIEGLKRVGDLFDKVADAFETRKNELAPDDDIMPPI